MRAVLSLIAIAALLVGAMAAGPREIPSTEANENYFEIVKEVLDKGVLESQNCQENSDPLEQCIRQCNSPGPDKRGNCCCVTTQQEGEDFGVAHFGLAGGCRYRQLLQNFTDEGLLVYESLPIDPSDSAQLFFDGNTCDMVDNGSEDGECMCQLKWTVDRSQLGSSNPLPSPSPSATPRRSQTPTATTTPTMASGQPSPSPDPAAGISSETPVPTTSLESGSTVEVPSEEPADGSEESGSPDEEGGDESDDGEADGNDDDNVCVDERYLLDLGFEMRHMVHQKSFHSAVWCPSHGGLPCGTSNHKIRMNGMSVSYKQLCEERSVPCHRDVVKVNSVWSTIWQEKAHGNAILTMYDVRYSETAQRLLHRVMRSVRTTL